jgi:hypothetical protein
MTYGQFVFDRVMDKAYLRDGSQIYTGEQLVLAMLLNVKKTRNTDLEKELETIMRPTSPKSHKPKGKRK